MKKYFALAIGLILAFVILMPPGLQAAEKPNIVLVFMDNFGWGEIGAYGGGILRGAPTPRIDSLADEGAETSELQCRVTVRTEPFGDHDRALCDPFRHV